MGEMIKKLVTTSSKNPTIIVEGVSPLPLLGIAFIILKLTNQIAWSWIWVLAPFWVSVVIVLITLAITLYVVEKSAKEVNDLATTEEVVSEATKTTEEPTVKTKKKTTRKSKKETKNGGEATGKDTSTSK